MLFRFLLVTLLTAAWAAQAQDRVVLLRDTTQLAVSPSTLSKVYGPAFATQAGEQGVFARQGKLFTDSMQAATQRLFQFIELNKKRLGVQGLLVETQEFIRPDGRYDWVFCQFMANKDLSPEQERQALALLREWYGQHPFPLKTKAGFRYSGVIIMGSIPQKRTARRGSGIISTLEAARQTTRPDTVTMLAFNYLGLTEIPDEVYRFPNLAELDLSSNQLHTLPARLTADCPSLQRLSVLYNRIPDDSVFFTPNRQLVALNLQGNRLTRIPASVALNRRLESLWLGNNKLTALNVKTLRRLRKLNDLNLYNSGLSQLPTGIGRLKRLQILDLYHNKLTVLPRQLGRLKRLEQLALAHNELRALPASVGRLRRLRTLYAHHNMLSALPARFSRLTNIQVLDLGHNWFSAVPEPLTTLPQLEELDLSHNAIQQLPTTLGESKQLKKVFLRANPLSQGTIETNPSAPIIRQLEANRTEVFY